MKQNNTGGAGGGGNTGWGGDGSLVTFVELFARSPVLGRCFFVSVKQYCPCLAITPQFSVGMHQTNTGGAGGGNTGGGGNGSLFM